MTGFEMVEMIRIQRALGLRAEIQETWVGNASLLNIVVVADLWGLEEEEAVDVDVRVL